MYLPPVVSFHLHTEYRKELSVKKIVLSALALVAAAGVANAQAINFRIAAFTAAPAADSQAAAAAGALVGGASNTHGAMGPFINNRGLGQTVLSAGAARTAVNNAAAANPSGSVTLNTVGQRITFVVQAQWTGIQGALGFASIGGNLTSNEASARATLQRYVENAITQANIDDGDPAARIVAGTFAPYNFLALNSSITDPAGNGDLANVGGNVAISQISGLQTGGSPVPTATGIWENVYAFSYTLNSNAAREVTFTFADPTGFSSPFRGTFGGQPDPIVSGYARNAATYSFNVIPAPGAAALLGLGGLLAARRRRA